MATKQQLTGLRYQDIIDLPESRRELLDGEFVVTPSPSGRHQDVVLRLGSSLLGYADERGGKPYVAPFDVFFSDSNVLQPDVLFVTSEHLTRIEHNFVRSAPDIVVEVSSPSTRRLELVRKHEIYERFGVGEYWYVDLDADRVEIYMRSGDRFALPVMLGRQDILESPLLPGFSLSVDELLGPPEDDAS